MGPKWSLLTETFGAGTSTADLAYVINFPSKYGHCKTIPMVNQRSKLDTKGKAPLVAGRILVYLACESSVK